MAQNRVIGRDGALPWRLPADLQHFKINTVDKPIIMGRLTYESIGRPLPRRRNLVLTRSPEYKAPNVEVFGSLDDALATCAGDEAMLIGGSQLYRLGYPLCQRMLITVVEADIPGDTLFPEFDVSQWSIVSREAHRADDRNEYDYTFYEFHRGDEGDPVPSSFPG